LNSKANILVFAAAALFGVACAFLLFNGPWIEAKFQTGHLPFQDWVLWFFGIALVGNGLYRLVTRGAIVDRRWPVWILVGGTMLYAEVFNVIPVKEMACRILAGKHHHLDPGACYKTD
jgi:hypothetical protein